MGENVERQKNALKQLYLELQENILNSTKYKLAIFLSVLDRLKDLCISRFNFTHTKQKTKIFTSLPPNLPIKDKPRLLNFSETFSTTSCAAVKYY